MNVDDLVNQLDSLFKHGGDYHPLRMVVNGLEYAVDPQHIRATPMGGMPESVTMALARRELLQPVAFMFEVDTDDGLHLEFRATAVEIYKEGNSQVVELWTTLGLLRREKPTDDME